MNVLMKIHSYITQRLNFGWKTRHILILTIACLGTFALLESRSTWSEMHRWNRAVGDMSLILISLSMSIGPLARLSAFFRNIVPWRRELGIYGVLLLIIHTVIILDGWIEWDLVRIIGYQLHPVTGQYVMLQPGFGLANIIGIIALLYGIILALVSNDWSQRILSGSVWKFVQQGAYVMWVLILIHTTYFMYMHFQHFHIEVPDPNWAQIPFVILITFVSLLQLAAFLKTWRVKQGLRTHSTRYQKTEAIPPVA